MTLSSSVRSAGRRSHREDGYVLLTLMLAVALMAIFAIAVAVPIKFELRREREEEMIHRGVQYTRAIRAYYKKFGRYPTRLEDLDNTNNLRYLRKHYKDPLTGKDFKLLHYGDPGLALTASLGGGTIPGANTVGAMNGSGNSAFGGGPGGSGSAFGGSPGSGFGGASNSAFGGGSSSTFGGGGFGGNSNSSFGGGFGNSSSSATSPTSSSSATANNDASGSAAPGTDPTQASTQAAPGTAQGSTSSSSQQVFGGGPIVGVASTSKETTIREYNKKKKYNEWQFIYDPTVDRGGLVMTPYQPALQIAGSNLNGQPGQNGQPGANSTSSPFGQSSFGNNNSSFGNGNGGFGNNSGSSFGGGSPAQPQAPPSSPQ